MWRLSVLFLIASASAQIPSLGWCPDYQPMANFNMKRFLGTWYEAERYFTVSEIVSRCVTTKYESTPEGRILVSNEITNSLTGLKRVMDGHLQMIGREGEGRIIVKYSALPIPYDTEYSILDTDYDSYAVMWSCSGIGPVHTQNAWVLTRERLAPIAVMQAAYGVLDRYKISRTFFVKTPQADCSILPIPASGPDQKNVEVVMEEKSAGVVPDVVVDKVDEQPVEKLVDPDVKPQVPEERSAAKESAEMKPMQVPELIMSESSEKKEEKMDKPEQMPQKIEMPEKDKPAKPDMPEMMESNESKEKDSKEKEKLQ